MFHAISALLCNCYSNPGVRVIVLKAGSPQSLWCDSEYANARNVSVKASQAPGSHSIIIMIVCFICYVAQYTVGAKDCSRWAVTWVVATVYCKTTVNVFSVCTVTDCCAFWVTVHFVVSIHGLCVCTAWHILLDWKARYAFHIRLCSNNW